MGFFAKIKEGLRKTKESVINRMHRVVNSFTKIDEELFEQLEETMIMRRVFVLRLAGYKNHCLLSSCFLIIKFTLLNSWIN